MPGPTCTPDRIRRRFWNRVDRRPDNCWIWTGPHQRHGYGIITALNKKWLVHRYSYSLANGDVPLGLFVCHRCDVRDCVNPDHLFLGTNTDNMADMKAKGRHVKWGGRPLCGRGHAMVGENVGINIRNSRFCRECTKINGRKRQQRLTARRSEEHRAAIDAALQCAYAIKYGSTDKRMGL